MRRGFAAKAGVFLSKFIPIIFGTRAGASAADLTDAIQDVHLHLQEASRCPIGGGGGVGVGGVWRRRSIARILPGFRPSLRIGLGFALPHEDQHEIS